jgi:hypothetical protein
MNIFVLDENPKTAAWMQCDRHSVKMVLETAQMLCTVLHSLGCSVPYRPTHGSHPCTKWVASSQEAFNWTVCHGLALCETYTARYGKIHASEKIIIESKKHYLMLPNISIRPFVQCMPEQYQVPTDPVLAYRKFYVGEKASFARWSPPASTPDWFTSMKNNLT